MALAAVKCTQRLLIMAAEMETSSTAGNQDSGQFWEKTADWIWRCQQIFLKKGGILYFQTEVWNDAGKQQQKSNESQLQRASQEGW